MGPDAQMNRGVPDPSAEWLLLGMIEDMKPLHGARRCRHFFILVVACLPIMPIWHAASQARSG